MEQLFAVFLGNVPVEIQEHRHVEHHLDGGEAEQYEIDLEVGAECIGIEQIEPAQRHEIELEGQVEVGPIVRTPRHHAVELADF